MNLNWKLVSAWVLFPGISHILQGSEGSLGSSVTRELITRAVPKILDSYQLAFNLISFKEFNASFQGSSLKITDLYTISCPLSWDFEVSREVDGLHLLSDWTMPVVESSFRSGYWKRWNSTVYSSQARPQKLFLKFVYDVAWTESSMSKEHRGCNALAVIFDLRPLSFIENQEGMSGLLEAVFQAGQSIPSGVAGPR